MAQIIETFLMDGKELFILWLLLTWGHQTSQSQGIRSSGMDLIFQKIFWSQQPVRVNRCYRSSAELFLKT